MTSSATVGKVAPSVNFVGITDGPMIDSGRACIKYYTNSSKIRFIRFVQYVRRGPVGAYFQSSQIGCELDRDNCILSVTVSPHDPLFVNFIRKRINNNVSICFMGFHQTCIIIFLSIFPFHIVQLYHGFQVIIFVVTFLLNMC